MQNVHLVICELLLHVMRSIGEVCRGPLALPVAGSRAGPDERVGAGGHGDDGAERQGELIYLLIIATKTLVRPS